MSKSEIFDAFVKIAQEKGMISEDAPEKAKKILEKTQRADSLDISAIEALYGVKPNLPKDMEYKRNIIEDAHPNSCVISPAHDKLNGLIENENERQNITLNIVNRNPHGHLNAHKNATRNFALTLAKIGNDLDNRNATQLRVLSDTCLAQVSLKKQAVWPIVIGVAATLGALYAQQHMSFANEGFQKNHEKLVAEVDDLLNSTSSWGVGAQYTTEFHNMVQQFKDKLNNFDAIYQKIYPLIEKLEKPRTAQELKALAQQPETNSVIQAYTTLRAAFEEMKPYLDSVAKNFSSESYKARQIQDKGVLTSLVDRMQIFHGGKGLVADDFDDVVRALDPYQKSVAEILDIFKQAKSIEESAKSQMEQSMSESQKLLGSEMSSKETNTTSPASKDEFGISDLEKEVSEADLSGL